MKNLEIGRQMLNLVKPMLKLYFFNQKAKVLDGFEGFWSRKYIILYKRMVQRFWGMRV